MQQSILQESQNSRKLNQMTQGKAKYFWILVLLGVVSASFWYGYVGKKQVDIQTSQTQENFTVKKDDLKIYISSDGKVMNDESVELFFPMSGTIQDVYIQEGQTVLKGDKIAKLETKELEFNLANAKTAKDIAVANLLSKQAGATSIDIELSQKNIAIAEKHLKDVQKQNELDLQNSELSLESAKLNLESIQKEIENSNLIGDLSLDEIDLNITQAYADAVVKMAIALTEINSSIYEADRILGINDEDANQEIEGVLGVKNSEILNESKNDFKVLMEAQKQYIADFKTVKADSEQKLILDKLKSALNLTKLTSTMLHNLSLVLENTTTSSSFTQTDLNNYKDKILSQHNSIKQEAETLMNIMQIIESAELSKKSKILATESTTTTNESKLMAAEKQYESAKLQLENTRVKATVSENEAKNQLEISQSQLQLKTEPVREVDVATLRAQITQAENQIKEAEYKLETATLFAPIDGVITSVNGEAGELMVNEKTDPFVTISNKGNFSVETYIEEIDITKIQLGQKTYFTFDAIDGLNFTGEVTYISGTPTIDNNGIVTYLIRASLTDLKDAPIREGMTAYVDFIIAEAQKVLVIPVAAVKSQSGKPAVLLQTGEWKNVQTGFTDGQMVEVLSGLEAGDIITYLK